MGKLIALVGVSGVGKTSLVEALGATGDFEVALEQHAERPFQALSQQEPQHVLANQLDYFQFRAAQEHELRAGARAALLDGGLDLDFHGFTRLFHERGWLSDREFDLCRRVYTLLRQLLPSPDLIVHLTAAPEIIQHRLAARDRINLASSKDAVLLDQFIAEWLEHEPADRILRIDVSEEDKSYAESVNVVRARLGLTFTDLLNNMRADVVPKKKDPGPTGEVVVPRRVIAVILGAIFALAFVLSPYWATLASTGGRLAVLAIILGLGAAWTFLSAAELTIRWTRREIFLLAAALLLVSILNFRAVTSVIPLRGDEAFHIAIILDLMNRIPPAAALAAGLLFGLAVYAGLTRSAWLLILALALEGCVAIFFFLGNPFSGLTAEYFLRYPFFDYWVLAMAPKVASIFINAHQEFLYRLIPLLSAAVLIWLLQLRIQSGSVPSTFAWGIAAATIPLLFYYSSILYLELPAVALMTVVCLNAGTLLSEDFYTIRRRPTWLALVLMGFLKETVIVFTFAFLAGRLVTWAMQAAAASKKEQHSPTAHQLAHELQLAFCMLLPSVLYLILRAALADTRAFAWGFSNLADLALYPIMIRAFLEQFGLFFVLFAAGWLLMIARKDYGTATMYLVIVVAFPLFPVMDRATYAGFSRFNLFLLAPLLVTSAAVVNRMHGRGSMPGVALALTALISNIWLSPVYLDGTKVPYWGNYLLDTSEHYYPYDQALPWIKDRHAGERILLSIIGYDTVFDFYFSKLEWHPDHELAYVFQQRSGARSLLDFLTRARSGDFEVVLFHLKEMTVPELPSTRGYCLERVFTNQAHALALFHRGSDCLEGQP